MIDPILQIVYTSIMAFIMLAAFLEWFLYLGAFLYCLSKAFMKAEHISVRIVSLIIGTLFAGMRYVSRPLKKLLLVLTDFPSG